MRDRLARARTATLLGSVLTSLSSGTNYVFSAYAPQLGSRLHITYTQLNVIGLSGNMGVYTTGVVFGRIADKRGPRLLLALSFLFLFAGYTGLRGYFDAGPSSDENLPLFSLIALSTFSYVTGAGGSAGLIAATNSTAKSFPERLRATTVGFVLSGFGLSAFFFSALAQKLYPGNTSSFLLFLSLATSLPVIIGFLTIRPVPHSEPPDAGPGGLTLHSEIDDLDSTSHLLSHSVVETLPDERGFSQVSREAPMGDHPVIDQESHNARATGGYNDILPAEIISYSGPLAPGLSPSRIDEGRNLSVRKPVSRTRAFAPPEPLDMHGKGMLTGWEFWILFTILSLTSGTGLMFINNVGTITQALVAKGNPDYDRIEAGKLQAAQVSIISLANCSGRLVFGMGADFLKSHFNIHRSYLLSLVSLLLMVSQIVCSHIENVNHLWQASSLLGLGYGGIFGLLPTITIEWFGLGHFSENWGFVSLAPLLGGNVFSILFGRDLDAHVPVSTDHTATNPVNLPPAETGRQCLNGRNCYRSTMVATALACAFALMLSVVAAWRDRRKASMKIYESLPQQPEILRENEADE